jgi:hypothetical protein
MKVSSQLIMLMVVRTFWHITGNSTGAETLGVASESNVARNLFIVIFLLPILVGILYFCCCRVNNKVAAVVTHYIVKRNHHEKPSLHF